MTNKQRCKKCIHKSVCLYKDYADYLGKKCSKYKPKPKKDIAINYVIPCVCTTHAPNVMDSCGYGMPILMPRNTLKRRLTHWYIKCPNCGRMGMLSYSNPQEALQEWNRVQTDLYAINERKLKIFEEIEMESYK